MRMLRNAAVMFVGKYNLACYLVESGAVSAERIA
jgi:hypothetical protein